MLAAVDDNTSRPMSTTTTTMAYPPVTPHGGLEKIFDNLYIVEGSYDMGEYYVRTDDSVICRGGTVPLISRSVVLQRWE